MLLDEMRHRERSRENRRTDRIEKLKNGRTEKRTSVLSNFVSRCVELRFQKSERERKREKERRRERKRDKER